MNSKEKLYAHYAGLAFIESEWRNDARAASSALLDLWDHAGYWGDRIEGADGAGSHPKMIRFPDGRQERLDTHKFLAAIAWSRWCDVDG